MCYNAEDAVLDEDRTKSAVGARERSGQFWVESYFIFLISLGFLKLRYIKMTTRGGVMADCGRAHAKEYFPEFLLPVSLSLWWTTATPHLCRRPSSTSSRVADRVLVLWPGVRPESLRWESRLQGIGPPETFRPHVISIGESSPRDLCINTKTQLHTTVSKLQCWMLHAKQLASQEHNPTH